MHKVVYISLKEGTALNLNRFPNAGPRPNITGMRRIYGKNACLVMCGGYLYNVDWDTYIRARDGGYEKCVTGGIFSC